MSRLRPPCAAVLLALTLLAGCQRARPYGGARPDADKPDAPKKEDKAEAKGELPRDYHWTDVEDDVLQKDVRIVFVHHGTEPEEWEKLKAFWNEGLNVADVASLIGKPGLPGAPAAAKGPPGVRVKVPLGLADPTSYVPATNPPTKRKWELGRRLFFDGSWLTAKGGTSCASCHDPDQGYTSGKREAVVGVNTPTLINAVYGRHQFWDGRATYLEEVVQGALEDEREPVKGAPFRHAWPGVIARLRASEDYKQRFHDAFGAPPSQDTVGKALATYVRLLLAGNSVHDRAVLAQGDARELQERHYLAVLKKDPKALEEMGRPKGEPAVVAEDLFRGYRLFRGKAACSSCHSPGDGYFSDGQFHNIGLLRPDEARRAGGRFAHAPLGEKGRHLRGAYKTPTLRGLPRTAPYFHDGRAKGLEAAVRAHVRADKAINPYLDPLLGQDGVRRDFGLGDGDVQALVQFLQALNGQDVDPFVKAAPKPGKRP